MGETFVLPEGKTSEETMYVPGTDGQKMSKSKTISLIFLWTIKRFANKL